jgi:hypothetical protein
MARTLKGFLRLLALGVACGLVCLSIIGASPSGLVGASSGPTAGIGVYSLGGHLSGIADPGVYSTVVGGSADATALASAPGRALAYFASVDVNTAWSTGVPYSEAAANHWLLSDSSGRLLTNQG